MKLTSFKELSKFVKTDETESVKKPLVSKKELKKEARKIQKKEKISSKYLPGTKVRLMDSNDEGLIIGSDNGMYIIEIDGLELSLEENQFVAVNTTDDIRLMNDMPIRSKEKTGKAKVDLSSKLIIDLHIEKIPGGTEVPDWAALDFQLNHFRQVINNNLKHKGRQLVFIHGVGDGTLASAIRKELEERFAISCSFTYNSFDKTNVKIL